MGDIQVFRESAGRMGGGLAFLSRHAGRQTAYVPSVTGWFDGWIMGFRVGGRKVQVVNVHLRPPVTESGSALKGYLTTSDDRKAEIQRFADHWSSGMPAIVCGDFNESPRGPMSTGWNGRVSAMRCIPTPRPGSGQPGPSL